MTNQKRNSATDSDKDARPTRLESMTVAELRQVARSLNRIPLTPEEISSVRRKRLINAIKSVMDMD